MESLKIKCSEQNTNSQDKNDKVRNLNVNFFLSQIATD